MRILNADVCLYIVIGPCMRPHVDAHMHTPPRAFTDMHANTHACAHEPNACEYGHAYTHTHTVIHIRMPALRRRTCILPLIIDGDIHTCAPAPMAIRILLHYPYLVARIHTGSIPCIRKYT